MEYNICVNEKKLPSVKLDEISVMFLFADGRLGRYGSARPITSGNFSRRRAFLATARGPHAEGCSRAAPAPLLAASNS